MESRLTNLSNLTATKIAHFVFIASFLMVEVTIAGETNYTIPTYQLEVALITGLALFVLTHRRVAFARVRRFLFLALGFLALQFVYFLFVNIDPIYGQFESYAINAFRLYVYLIVVFLFSVLFYEEKLFLKWFYRGAVATAMIAILSWIAYQLTNSHFLLDSGYGSPRVQALMTEPSATAPVIGSGILLSWKRRSYSGLALFIAFGILSRSATVILVVLASMIGVYLLERGGAKAVLTGIGVFVLGIVGFIVLGGPDWMIRNNIGGDTAERLINGIRFAITLSEQGYNPRMAGAIELVQQMWKNGFLLTGYGLNSADVYFRPLTPPGEPITRTYSLYLFVLFSYGVIGVLVLLSISITTIFRVARNNRDILYVLIPFLMMSFINSAGGFISYKFLILGLVVYSGSNIQPRASSQKESPRTVLASSS